jgi:uncharacterized protein YutE (UPF0331/DUF86 family)
VARELGEVGVTPADVTARFVVMARYRNRMVHFYDEVTDRELYELLTTHLDGFRVSHRRRHAVDGGAGSDPTTPPSPD